MYAVQWDADTGGLLNDYLIQVSDFERDILDSPLAPLLSHPLIQRMRHVSFLSTLNIIHETKHDFSRYDHSLGVAFLSNKLGEQLNLTEHQRMTFITAGILHDISHSPFSHASEPFVRANLKRYHEGRLGSLLKNVLRDIDDGRGCQTATYRNTCSLAKSAISDACRLLTGKGTDSLVTGLWYGAICLDTLDGINRTAYSLGLKTVNPIELIENFYVKNGKIMLSRQGLNEIDQFWRLQVLVYRQYIYTLSTLTAEAMLTRALELVFQTNREVRSFTRMIEPEVIERIKHTPIAQQLLQMLQNRRLFQSLPQQDYLLGQQMYAQFKVTSWQETDPKKELESQVAMKYGISPVWVVFHFSWMSQFLPNSIIWQLNMFNSNSAPSPLDDLDWVSISNAYSRTRLPNSWFGIFLPNAEERSRLCQQSELNV